MTQNGKSNAVVLDVAEYEALISRLELLQDVHQAEEEISDVKTSSHAAAKEKIRKKIIEWQCEPLGVQPSALNV